MIKNLFKCLSLIIVVTALIVSCNEKKNKTGSDENPLYKDASASVEDRIDDLMSRMTIEDKAAFEKTSRIGQRFNFDLVEIPNGSVLEFLRDSSYTCIVKSKNKVEYEGEEHTLSSAGLKVMNEHLGFSWTSLAGPLNWKYEGEVLDQRRQRFEEVE